MLTILGGILAAVTVIKGAQWARGLFRGRGGAPIGGSSGGGRAASGANRAVPGPSPANPSRGRGISRKVAGGVATVGGIIGTMAFDNWRQNRLSENPNELGSNKDAAINAASNALNGALLGGTIGSIIPGLGTAIGATIGGIGGALYGWLNAKNQGQEARNRAVQGSPKDYGFATGGIVGGTSYTGDKLTAHVNSGEMVLNAEQQANLFKHINTPFDKITGNGVVNMHVYKTNTQILPFDHNERAKPQVDLSQRMNIPFIRTMGGTAVAKMMGDGVTSVLTNRNDIQAKPVGNKEYIYTPQTVQTSTVNGNTITVKDFNLNVKGSIRLEGGNSSRDIDMNALLNDLTFVNALKEVIKQSINNDINGGRLMNDVAQMRGLPVQTTLWGR